MKVYRSGKTTDFKYARGKEDLYGRTFHSCYEIYLLLHGEVEYISPYTRQKLKPFQLVMIPPGEYHQFKLCADADRYERCVINMDGDAFKAEILDSVSVAQKIFSLSRNHRIVQNFMYLAEGAESMEEEDFLHILEAVSTDIVVSLKYCTDEQAPFAENLSDLAQETMHYIDEHYTEAFALTDLAGKLHCSVSLMCHEFKDNFGISIKKYVMQKRMNQSKADLKNGAKPEEVSVKYGFSSYSSFYRAYRNYFGIAPSKTEKNLDF